MPLMMRPASMRSCGLIPSEVLPDGLRMCVRMSTKVVMPASQRM